MHRFASFNDWNLNVVKDWYSRMIFGFLYESDESIGNFIED